MREIYLVTGLGGSGKSTLEKIFRNISKYQTYDIDDGYAQWRDKTTGSVVDYKANNEEWNLNSTWVLDKDTLISAVNKSDKPVIVFGMTNDLSKYAAIFKKIFVLEYKNKSTIKDRLYNRLDGFGKNEPELQRILRDYQPYQQDFKTHGAMMIDCTLLIDEIAAIISKEIDAVTNKLY